MITSDNQDAIIFVSGLGMDIRRQREVFIRRFAKKHQTNYLALDCTKQLSKENVSTALEEKSAKVIEQNFSDKNLYFFGFCFGGNIALRLANRFTYSTKVVLMTSPAIDYSAPSIMQNIIKWMERRNAFFSRHQNSFIEQSRQFNEFKTIAQNVIPIMTPQPQTYQGDICILHPEDDTFIPVENSKKMLQEMKRENIELSVLKNESHTFHNDFKLRTPLKYLATYMQKTRD
jgi:esterase/lipase